MGNVPRTLPLKNDPLANEFAFTRILVRRIWNGAPPVGSEKPENTSAPFCRKPCVGFPPVNVPLGEQFAPPGVVPMFVVQSLMSNAASVGILDGAVPV